MKDDREPAYGSDPSEQTDPILVDTEMDVRIHLRVDLRKFLSRYGIDPQSGEPTPDELQVHLLCCLMQYLSTLPYMTDADATFIDDAIL